MYMREAGKSVKLAVVTIDKKQAAVVRATINPDKLAEFINNPKIFGITLDDNKQPATDKSSEPKENVVTEEKNKEQKKDN